jgi:hypothetical protein
VYHLDSRALRTKEEHDLDVFVCDAQLLALIILETRKKAHARGICILDTVRALWVIQTLLEEGTSTDLVDGINDRIGAYCGIGKSANQRGNL